MRGMLIVLAALALAGCSTPAGVESCQQTAVESWPRFVRTEDPANSSIVQDTTMLSCSVGDTVERAGVAVSVCIYIG